MLKALWFIKSQMIFDRYASLPFTPVFNFYTRRLLHRRNLCECIGYPGRFMDFWIDLSLSVQLTVWWLPMYSCQVISCSSEFFPRDKPTWKNIEVLVRFDRKKYNTYRLPMHLISFLCSLLAHAGDVHQMMIDNKKKKQNSKNPTSTY